MEEWAARQPSWCNPWDQDTEESPSVTTTLFASYLRILLYNKFDVAKPSDHITTIKLIPPSYSGGPSLSQSVSRLTNNQLTQLGEKLFSSSFLSNTVDSSQCFCFPLVEDGAIVFCPCPDPIRVCWFLQRQGQWHLGQLTTSKHKSSGSGRQSLALVWFSTIKP